MVNNGELTPDYQLPPFRICKKVIRRLQIPASGVAEEKQETPGKVFKVNDYTRNVLSSKFYPQPLESLRETRQ